MASQTEAQDDLIAELARLMADDARAEPKSSEPRVAGPAPIRVPGGEVSTSPAPPQNPAPRSPAPAPGVRIPGGEPTVAVPRPIVSSPAAPKPSVLPASAPAPAATAPVVAKPVEPAPVVPEPGTDPADMPELDNDSLADLIAAELANEMTGSKPVQPAAPVRSEDNFGVPPVFGFGSPAATAVPPSAAAVTIVDPEPLSAAEPVVVEPVPEVSDPLRDIERLVEPALQMAPAAPTPSPALRSLATPTLPPQQPARRRVEPGLNTAPQTGSIDDAILAAAAATGARVEWVNPDVDAGAAPSPAPAARRSRRGPVFGLSRAVAGPLVALSLLIVAGVGLYWMLGRSAEPAGPAPLIAADTAAIKEVPEPVETATRESVVFNEIAGTETPDDEQIVSRDQADEEAVTEAASVALSNSGVLADTTDPTAVDTNSDGLVNRRVRTVTVRPDGTIVSGEDSVAGASILPVDRPNVPDVPGADFSTPDLIANGGDTSTTTTQTASLPEVPAAPAAPAVVPIEAGAVVPVVDATGTAVAGRTTATPVQRPADLAQTASTTASATTTTPAAPATTASATPQAAPPPAGNAGAYVQLSSQRSEDAARESAEAIVARYGPLFGGANLEVQRVDLGERGIYYRVLVPASDRASADNICTNLRAAGGDCLIL
jgi:hypothetical protein